MLQIRDIYLSINYITTVNKEDARGSKLLGTITIMPKENVTWRGFVL